MEWKGALRNAESRLNVLKFNQREELEALQLTSKQWRRTVDRYSPELALRRIGYVKMDRMWGATFYFGETNYPQRTAHASDAAFSTEGFDDEETNCDSAEFDARVANSAKVAMTTPKCTRADEGSPTGIVATDFGANFCAWIKALQQIQADVCVRTLEVFEPYYKIGMDTVYRHLGSIFSVHEYSISKTNIGTRDIDRFDELCVDVLKEAKRVSIHVYNLDDDDDDDEAEDEQHEDNFDVDDKPKMNGSVKNIIDFVFSSPRCEELYLAVDVGGKGLFDKFIRRFQRLPSTRQMLSTFTWKWSVDYEWSDWGRNKCAKPLAKGQHCPFKDVTLERRRRQFQPERNGPDLRQDIVEPLSGDVYEFMNAHDGTYLTVVVAQKHRIVQFRKGRFEPVEAATH